jgi:LacI family transcriptional regulator
MKSATIADVAELAGVSKATVSAVLNNKDVVKESTRRTVLRAMDALHYRPSPSARRGFRPQEGRCISVVVKEAQNPFFAEIFAGIQEVAAEKGYLVSLSSSEGELELEQRLVNLRIQQETKGLILSPIIHHDTDLSHLYELKRSGMPFVLLEMVRGIRANLIEVDNVKLTARVVSYLIGLGHTRIVHFGGPRYSQHGQERAEGVRRAFSESHLVFDASMIVEAGHSLEDGYRAGLAYFREHTGPWLPTAVTCYNDLVAVGLLRALREMGIAVPDAVSVVGFDGLKLLEYIEPALTTVHVPKHEMGRLAAEMLIRQIEAEAELPAERIFLDAELVVRHSTSPPASRPIHAAAAEGGASH